VSPSKRSRMVFIAAAAVAIALVAVLAGHWAAGSAAGVGQSGGGGSNAIGFSDAGATSTGTAADPQVIDPAKQEPVLDKFRSKDPFLPLPATLTSSPVSSPSPSASPSSGGEITGAEIKINGTLYTVSEGDKVPPGKPVFLIAKISASEGVEFGLLNGRMFEDGSTSVTVEVGGRARATVAGKSYDLSVLRLRYAEGSLGGGGGGGGGGGTSQGHSIKVLSIDSQNGTASATFDVDGTTYADKQVGRTFTTDWGQIRVEGIDFAGQTVTILYGDVTLTLHAGQAVVK
jgi:hypothetical protein